MQLRDGEVRQAGNTDARTPAMRCLAFPCCSCNASTASLFETSCSSLITCPSRRYIDVLRAASDIDLCELIRVRAQDTRGIPTYCIGWAIGVNVLGRPPIYPSKHRRTRVAKSDGGSDSAPTTLTQTHKRPGDGRGDCVSPTNHLEMCASSVFQVSAISQFSSELSSY